MWRGDLLVMLGSLSWAMTTLYMKRFMVQSLTGFQMLYAQVLVSTPFLWSISRASEGAGLESVTPLGLAIIVFQAVVIVFLSYLAWMALLRQYPASSMQSFTFLTPVWGVLLGAVLLGEALTLVSLVGMAMVGLGLVLVNRPRRAAA